MKEVLKNYKRQGIRILATAIRGGIQVVSQPQKLTIFTTK